MKKTPIKNIILKSKKVIFFINQNIIYWLKKIFLKPKGIYYINGPETLPPPLGKKEENKIMQKIINGETGNIREPLITHNLRLVVYIAKKFDSSGIPIEDLISIGTIGLIKAVNTFSPLKNIKLDAYPTLCVRS